MMGLHEGARRVLAFGAGVLAGCTVARLAMWRLQPPARKRAST